MDFEECFACGISGQRARLMDAISSKGIEKVCEKCAQSGSIPVLKRPTSRELKDSEKAEEARPVVPKRVPVDKPVEETTLRDIVDRSYLERAPKDVRPRPDLIEHFHWAIMRARRAKRLTHEQVAREIGESVSAVKNAEQGILPEDDNKLVNKFESFFGIRLLKEGVQSPAETSEKRGFGFARRLGFDKKPSDEITVDDLRQENTKKEEGDIFDEVREKMAREEGLGEKDNSKKRDEDDW